MLSFIIEAAENFCIHQIQRPFFLISVSENTRTLFAYIDIESNGVVYRTFVGCDNTLINNITEIFLGETNCDDQTYVDMLLETANMIIGSAKIIASDVYSHSFSISTPFFSDIPLHEENFEEIQKIRVDEGILTLALQRL